MASLFNRNRMRRDSNSKTGLGMIRVKHSWFVMLLLGSSIACTPQSAGNSTPTLFAGSQTAPTIPAMQSPREPAKTTVIQVKGTPQTVPISSVETSSFSTDFPTDRFAQIKPDASSQTKDNIAFYWKKPGETHKPGEPIPANDGFIALVLSDKDLALRDLKKSIEEQLRLNEEAGTGVRRVNQGSDLSYAKAYSSWLRDVVRFEISSKESGNVPGSKNAAVVTYYFGEAEGRAFFVMSTYARQNEEEFTARADVILRNLKFKGKEQG